MEKISVIIPTYNRSHLITRSIQSVLNQTYKDFELIVVDDGSTDNTEEIIKGFDDERIRFIRHQKNRGAAAARNTGIRAAHCDYIAFQDSDDEWFPNKLEKQINLFGESEFDVGVIYTGFWRVEKGNQTYIPKKEIIKREGYIHKELLNQNFVTTQSMLLRKECFNKIGLFDENLPRQQDWDLVIRISGYFKFRCINEPLLVSYYQPKSISADRIALINALEMILDKHFNEFKKDKNILERRFFELGDLLCSEGYLKKGRDYFIKAVKVHPPNFKAICAAIISLSGKKMYNKAVSIYHKIIKN